MTNVFIVLTLLASFYVSNSQYISYGPDCVSWIANTDQCQVYYYGYESTPSNSCCSEINYISIDSHCLCESSAINKSFPFDVTKILTLPSVCGVASPCDGVYDAVILPSGSPPPKSLKPSDPDNLVPQASSELGPSYAPNSPLAQPTPSPTAAANTKSSGSLIVYPYSISIVVYFISLLFLYFS